MAIIALLKHKNNKDFYSADDSVPIYIYIIFPFSPTDINIWTLCGFTKDPPLEPPSLEMVFVLLYHAVALEAAALTESLHNLHQANLTVKRTRCYICHYTTRLHHMVSHYDSAQPN